MNKIDILQKYGSVLDDSKKEQLVNIMYDIWSELDLDEFDKVAKRVATKLWQGIEETNENLLGDLSILEEDIIQSNIVQNVSSKFLGAGLLGLASIPLVAYSGYKIYNYFSKGDEEK